MAQRPLQLGTAAVVASVGLLVCAGSVMAAPHCFATPVTPVRDAQATLRENSEDDGMAELVSCIEQVLHQLHKLEQQRIAAASLGGGAGVRAAEPQAVAAPRPACNAPPTPRLHAHLLNLPPPQHNGAA